MALNPSTSFLEKNALDQKAPVYIAYFPELEYPNNQIYFTTTPLPFLSLGTVNGFVWEHPNDTPDGLLVISGITVATDGLVGHFAVMQSGDAAGEIFYIVANSLAPSPPYYNTLTLSAKKDGPLVNLWELGVRGEDFISITRDSRVILRPPSSLSQQIIPEEGRASISASNLSFVDLDGFFTQFIAQDVKSSLHNRKVVILAGYQGMTSLEEFLPVYTGRVKEYSESPSGVYKVEINDAQKALQRKLFRNAAKEDILEEGDVQAVLLSRSIKTTSSLLPPYLPNAVQIFPNQSPGMFDDQYVGRGFVPISGNGNGNQYYVIANDSWRVVVSTTIGGASVNLAAWGITIDDRFEIRPAPLEVGADVTDVMPPNAYEGKLFIPTTGSARGKNFYIISNSYETFTLSDNLYYTGGAEINPASFGITAGHQYKVTHHYQDDIPQPQHFFCNPITLLLMWLTSTGDPFTNGHYDRLSYDNGLGIDQGDIDIERFEGIRDLYFPGDSHNMYFIIEKRQTAKKFFESEIFKVLGMYPILRGDGKISVTIFKPPLPLLEAVPVLNESNIVGTPKWKGNLQSMVNEIAFHTNWDGSEFLLNQFFLSGDSFLDRGEGKKELNISSQGLKDSSLGGTRLFSTIVNRRVNAVFSRFAIPPIELDIGARFDRLLVEAGDMVDFSHHLTPDIKNGIRGQEPILMEVLKRSVDWAKGSTKLTLLDTGFGKGAYQVITPGATIIDDVSATVFNVDHKGALAFSAFLNPVVKFYKKSALEMADGCIIIDVDIVNDWITLQDPLIVVPEPGWFITFDDYDNVTDEQKAWGYIAQVDSGGVPSLGIAEDPPHLIVP